jgi:hypothetical protein
MIDAAVRGAIAGQRGAGGSGLHTGGGHLDERYFRRVEKYDGVKGNWKEFAFQFKVAVGMVHPKTREFLEEIQKEGKAADLENIFVGEVGTEQVEKMGAEL